MSFGGRGYLDYSNESHDSVGNGLHKWRTKSIIQFLEKCESWSQIGYDVVEANFGDSRLAGHREKGRSSFRPWLICSFTGRCSSFLVCGKDARKTRFTI
jgi:hypothetical protein